MTDAQTMAREIAEYSTLRAANVARQQEWDAGNQITLAYRGNELAGEVGEACNIIKKLERERLGIRGSRASVDALAAELADVVICADLIAMSENIDLDAAVANKFNATSEKVGLRTRLASALTASPAAAMREAAIDLANKVEQWGKQQCPCKDEVPDPCPLCGASVEGKDDDGVCKALRYALPHPIWGAIERVRALPLPSPEPAGAEDDEAVEDGEIQDALDDAVVEGEGRIHAESVRRYLTKIGLKIVRASSAEAEIERLREIDGANILNKNALALCKARLSAREAEIERAQEQIERLSHEPSLLALADTITDEMAERGGRALAADDFPIWSVLPDDVKELYTKAARAVFAEMCRAAAGKDGRDG